MSLPADVVATVEAELQKLSPPLSMWNSIVQVLKQNKLAWTAVLRADGMLVHPANRGGMGVNPHSCHAKAASLMKTGWDASFLHSSFCFEVSDDPTVRQGQFSFNQEMVSQSAGLLGAVGQHERHLSVSAGHTSQFVKAAAHGCRTSEATLADSTGKLNVQALCEDAEFKKLLQAGWTWTVIANSVEKQWPQLPKLAERALNASNATFSGPNELELCLYLVDRSKGDTTNLQDVAAEATQGGPLHHYAKHLATWVTQFSNQATFLKFLVPFSKQFGQNVNLGEDFWTSLVMSLPEQYPCLRLAFLATNFTCHRVSNGYARLLLKSDVEKLKNKKLQSLAIEAEELLYKAWNRIEAPLPNSAKSFGILCLRCCLHVVDKEKMGREGKTFSSLTAIFQAFEVDIAGSAPPAPTSSPTASSTSAPLVALGEAYDPLWLAQQKMDIKKGLLYTYDEGLWRLVDLSSDKLVLEAAGLFQTGQAEIATSDCLKLLKLSKSPAPFILQTKDALANHPSRSLQAESKQADLWTMLLAAAEKLEKKVFDMVGIEGISKKLYTKQKIKAGELLLVPVTDTASKLTLKAPGDSQKHAVLEDNAGTMFFVLPPKALKLATESSPLTGSTAPFWYVPHDDEDGNLDLKAVQFRNCSIYCLTNPKGIEKHTELSCRGSWHIRQPVSKKPRTKK
ncbi:unnamed protein product [Symbiodinium sp. CCMP2592]|nr:unnamed protein product [Symbiodinium sp. CCMP2592]